MKDDGHIDQAQDETTRGHIVHRHFEEDLRELDYLAADIRNKMNRTHLNARVVSETIAPMVDQARCALMSSDRQSRAFVDTVLVALRDFDDAL